MRKYYLEYLTDDLTPNIRRVSSLSVSHCEDTDSNQNAILIELHCQTHRNTGVGKKAQTGKMAHRFESFS